MVKDKELTDDPPFVDISVDHKGGGIEVKLNGARAVVLNEHDAQFLCDSLYVMLDDMDQKRLDAEEEEQEGCGNHGCIIAPPKGQGTNGRCRCKKEGN